MDAGGLVTSARDPRVVRAARLLRDGAARAAEGRFVVDDPGLLAAARAAGVVVEDVLGEDVPLPADAARALSAVGQRPGVVAVCRTPAPPAGRVPASALVLCGVTGAGNVGAIVRTAAALRLPRVELVEGCGDVWSRPALRAAQGATFAPGLVRAGGGSLAELRADGPLVAAVPRGGADPRDLPPDAVVVLGSERDGLTAGQLARCDLRVTVPAPGFESLNVAAAAAILAWELARRRPGA